ncbi:MAG: hypothetical protein KC496_02685 [Anaerolineae bacterium]|nr:hypothetical protein [Anaerolineae bacterium]
MTKRTHNWPVWGHDWAVDFLRKSMAHGRNRHAYLITGTSSIGKNQLAHAFAMALNCTHEDPAQHPCGECRSCRLIYSGNHPDMLYSQTDEKSGQLKIDTIRDVMRLLALKPFDSRYRVAIFDDFDAAQPRAQDALLKTLEEPAQHAVLILLAQSTERVMSTITSRCQIVPLRPVPQETVHDFLMMHGAEEERATLLARLSNGRIGWALNALRDEVVMQERDDMLAMLENILSSNRAGRFAIAEDMDKLARKDKMAISNLLETWQTYWRDVLLLAQGSPVKPCNSDRHVQIQQIVQRIQPEDAFRALKATRTTLNETMKTNASVRLALEVLFLDYPGLA